MPTAGARDVTIVMAAFNEEEALPECAARNLAYLEAHSPDGRLIIVDDGSSDATPQIIDELAAEHPRAEAVHLPFNQGMGAALLAGFERAQTTWVTIMPADGQIDPFELNDFLAAAEQTGAPVITSIYRNRVDSTYRRVMSRGLRALTVAITGTRARSEGIYLIRRDVLMTLGARSTSFMLNLEVPIRARRAGHRVETIQMSVHPRAGGVSKAATPGRIARTFNELCRLRLAMERERIETLLGRGR